MKCINNGIIREKFSGMTYNIKVMEVIGYYILSSNFKIVVIRNI